MMIQNRFFPATGMPDRDWWHALWPSPDDIIAALRIKRGMTVVDLGCGYGYFTAALSRRVGPGRVIGFDLDSVLLEQAKVTCAGMTNCDWLLGDAMALSHLLDAPVDYVLIANTFHGVPNKTALTNEVATVLKPDGQFAVINWHPLPREQTTVLNQPRGPSTELRMSSEQTRAVVEPAGFTLETLIELPPYHYATIFVRANEC